MAASLLVTRPPRVPEPAAAPSPLKQAAAREAVPSQESKSSEKDREPIPLVAYHQSSSRGAEAAPRALPMILMSDWESYAVASSSSGRAAPRCAKPEGRGVTGEAPATEHLPRAGELSRIPSTGHVVEERPSQALELARGRSTVRHNLLQVAASVLGLLGEELADVDSCLEVENLCLAREWHQLKVAINLAHLHHERTRADVDGSLAASQEACIRAREEVRAAE